ncbi:MAG: hypothetical protein K2X53_05010 [Alphaproteobacteria bacterium]|nr:hypothetical protein [Alphaproteobacteria bacterium]
MRKFFTKLGTVSLLCLTPALFNPSALLASTDIVHAEKKITVLNESADSMAKILGMLEQHGVKLHETAFFFDFDETIATMVADWSGHTYHLLASPDLYRTYVEAFNQARNELKVSDDRLLRPTNILWGHSHYEVLDDTIVELIVQLKAKGAHVGVCSALQANQDKLNMLKKVGIDPKDYTYASGGKAKTIEQYLQHNLQKQKVSTIVLIDNSFKYALEGYASAMGALAKELSQTKDVPEIKIIGIEFTKFNKMATAKNMKAELELMRKSLSIPSSLDTQSMAKHSTM